MGVLGDGLEGARRPVHIMYKRGEAKQPYTTWRALPLVYVSHSQTVQKSTRVRDLADVRKRCIERGTAWHLAWWLTTYLQ